MLEPRKNREDPQARCMDCDNNWVEPAYLQGRALNDGVSWGVGDIIDPADSRHWLRHVLRSGPEADRSGSKKHRNMDAWWASRLISPGGWGKEVGHTAMKSFDDVFAG